jgi:hypothetical protein
MADEILPPKVMIGKSHRFEFRASGHELRITILPLKQMKSPTSALSTPNRVLIYLLLYVATLHGLMLIYDVVHPDIFLHADRAISRLDTVRAYLSLPFEGPEVVRFLITNGIPGDYYPQALFYLVGGQYSVILAQIGLLIGATATLYKLTLLLTRSASMSLAAVLIYVHLPHNLVFPHALASEAIFDPLVVISFCYAGRFCIEHRSWWNLMVCALTLGLATLVRPITILWPIVFMVLFLWGGAPVRKSAVFMIASLLPLLMWMTFIGYQTGSFSMGNSDHDAAHNLYNRMKRIVEKLPPMQRIEAERGFLSLTSGNDRTLSAAQYFQFALNYPVGFVSHLAKDGMVFLGKSGIEKVTVDYLDTADGSRAALQDENTGWRKQWESNGTLATGVYLFTKYPGLIISSIVGALLMLTLWILAALGILSAFRRIKSEMRIEEKFILLCLALFPLYVFAVSQVVDAMQSRHRAPSEFALCILAVLGWSMLRARSGRCPNDS